jgi:hypothetical protein
VVGADRHVGRLRSVRIRLPNGLGLSAAKLGDDLSVRLDGRRVHASFSYSHGVLTVGFARTGRVAIITITSPALRVSRRDAALIRARHEHGLGLAARVDGTRGHQTIKLRPDA